MEEVRTEKFDEVWLALQLCDSSFPGGTLANSQGLESALHHNLVHIHDTESLTKFAHLCLEQVSMMEN